MKTKSIFILAIVTISLCTFSVYGVLVSVIKYSYFPTLHFLLAALGFIASFMTLKGFNHANKLMLLFYGVQTIAIYWGTGAFKVFAGYSHYLNMFSGGDPVKALASPTGFGVNVFALIMLYATHSIFKSAKSAHLKDAQG